MNPAWVLPQILGLCFFFRLIRCEELDSQAVILTVKMVHASCCFLPIHGNLCIDVLFSCNVDGYILYGIGLVANSYDSFLFRSKHRGHHRCTNRKSSFPCKVTKTEVLKNSVLQHLALQDDSKCYSSCWVCCNSYRVWGILTVTQYGRSLNPSLRGLFA